MLDDGTYSIGSMYGIFTHIWLILMVTGVISPCKWRVVGPYWGVHGSDCNDR